MAVKTTKAPQSLTVTLDLTATYQDKRGHSMTLREALDLFHGDVVKAIFLGAGKKAATTRDAARRSSGAAPSEMRLPGNLPPEVATMLDTVRQAIATAVPSMAPKAPSAPKAAPVPALDLSDPLEVAVSEELKPTPEAPKAKKEPKAVKAALAATAPRKARKLTPKAVKAALAATEPAPVAPVEAPPVPVVVPEVVQAAPVVHTLSGGVTTKSDMTALRAAYEARKAAKKAAKA